MYCCSKLFPLEIKSHMSLCKQTQTNFYNTLMFPFYTTILIMKIGTRMLKIIPFCCKLVTSIKLYTLQFRGKQFLNHCMKEYECIKSFRLTFQIIDPSKSCEIIHKMYVIPITLLRQGWRWIPHINIY